MARRPLHISTTLLFFSAEQSLSREQVELGVKIKSCESIYLSEFRVSSFAFFPLYRFYWTLTGQCMIANGHKREQRTIDVSTTDLTLVRMQESRGTNAPRPHFYSFLLANLTKEGRMRRYFYLLQKIYPPHPLLFSHVSLILALAISYSALALLLSLDPSLCDCSSSKYCY